MMRIAVVVADLTKAVKTHLTKGKTVIFIYVVSSEKGQCGRWENIRLAQAVYYFSKPFAFPKMNRWTSRCVENYYER